MGRFSSLLGKGIASAVLIILAGGIFLAFMTMGPQRQTAAMLAPTPTPAVLGQATAPTATPQGQKPASPFPTPTPVPENTPIYIETFNDIIPSHEWAASQSESAITGVVKSKLAARWNTPDGKRPAVYWGLPREEHLKVGIFTPVVVEVQRYLYNPQPEKDLIVAVWGGQVGVDSQKVGDDDVRDLQVGQTFLAFISRHSNPTVRDTVRVEGKVFWIPAFKHEITPEGRARNKFVDLPMEEVVRQIEAAAASKR